MKAMINRNILFWRRGFINISFQEYIHASKTSGWNGLIILFFDVKKVQFHLNLAISEPR